MVRHAEPRDLEAINRIENDAIENTFAHFGLVPVSLEDTEKAYCQAKDTYPWVVKELEGKVVGFARATAWKPREAYRKTTEIGVYVDGEFQGKGIGKELYTALFPALKEMGFRTILAGIAQPNEPSVRLHEAFGMVHVGTLPNVGFKHGEWRSVGYWAKELADD
jgi:L-amino acid N-acyltransferase YncA